MAGGYRQTGKRFDLQAFFISLAARYKRIRKRPRGVPSPQLYQYKREKLQELEKQEAQGCITLYYADESHICTEGYVPYGWQFSAEQVCIPSQRAARLNIFGIIDRKNNYQGFTSTDSITAEKVAGFLDTFSLSVRKDTFVVLDNASVHRNHKIRELRSVWEKRGLFLFYLPPYSPHLNLAETLWRILKGKWRLNNWYPATVPGIIHTDQMANGIIEDPFFRLNERSVQWIDKEDWMYETHFDVDDETCINLSE